MLSILALTTAFVKSMCVLYLDSSRKFWHCGHGLGLVLAWCGLKVGVVLPVGVATWTLLTVGISAVRI